MRQRIAAIDVIRGYCLVNIYINHIMIGVLAKVSPSNLGFSDSADIFVFLAGASTFLAFGGLGFRDCVRALWGRATKLYWCNILLIVCTLAVLVALAQLNSLSALLHEPQLRGLMSQSWPSAAWHLFTLQQSLGFSMVLRLYVGLMVLAPLFVWLAARRWWWVLPPAAVVWIAAGQLKLVAHDSLTGAPLMLNILPWSLTFACGMALTAAMAQGVRLPRPRLLTGAALALVLGYVVLLYALPHWPEAQAWVETRNDSFWLGSSKSMMSPLRVLHLLALVYLFIVLADALVVRLVHRARPTAFLAVLGRRSLPVFVTGAVLAVFANETLNLAGLRWGAHSPPALALELLLVIGGVALLWAVAARPWSRRRPTTQRIPQNGLLAPYTP